MAVLSLLPVFDGLAQGAEKFAELRIAYLAQGRSPPPARSNLDPFIADKGLYGARLAIADNNTTGQFTKQAFTLKEMMVPVDGDIVASYHQLLGEGYQVFITNIDTDWLLKLADATPSDGTLLLDAVSRDDNLRDGDCRRQIFHLLPSRAMRADALAQYLLKKRWKQWFLVIGPSREDRLYADAIKRAAKRYGIAIVAEKNWGDSHDARRTAQSEVPVFTQGVEYDVLLVADEAGLFGEYLPYRTWIPRPVAGTQGLVATSWHRTHEQWGAVQLQNRFRALAGRWMTEEDYGAWLAVRAIGESATRTQSVDFRMIVDYLRGDTFALAGFKGKKLSFRAWNGQLRQPVLLAADRSMVSVAPVDGYLHPKNILDTLGVDMPESKCRQ